MSGARRQADQALAVPVEPVSRLDPSGFDPSRGVDPGEEGILEYWAERKRMANRRRNQLVPLKWKKVIALRRALSIAQGGRCYYCRVEMTPSQERAPGHDPRAETLEHLDEVCAGGNWTEDNCVAACKSCNNLRGRLLLTIRRLEAALATRQLIPHQIHHLAERLSNTLARWEAVTDALAAGTRSDETRETAAQSEGCQSGGDSRNAQPLPPLSDSSTQSREIPDHG